MVFWSSFSRKIKEIISRREFNELKNKVDSINNKVESNTGLINQNRQNITTKAEDNQVVKLSGNQTINGDKTFRGGVEFGTRIKAGYGGAEVKFTPEDNTAKTLMMYDSATGNNCYFNINMSNKGTIKNVPNPRDNNDVANKSYVDSKAFNANNYYTKSDSDGRYYQKSQVYTKAESDSNYINYTGTQTITGRKNFSTISANYIYANGNSGDSQSYIYFDGYINLNAKNRIYCSGRRISNVATPSDASDAATKQYADTHFIKLYETLGIALPADLAQVKIDMLNNKKEPEKK